MKQAQVVLSSLPPFLSTYFCGQVAIDASWRRAAQVAAHVVQAAQAPAQVAQMRAPRQYINHAVKIIGAQPNYLVLPHKVLTCVIDSN